MDLGIEGLGEATWIGAGASATVYRARQGRLDREVAVKVLTERNPDFVRRFEREARMLGQLSQKPGIVTVYDTGVTANGEPYLILELCPSSLLDRLDRSGTIGPAEACRIMADVARAVSRAHENGVVHRDLKPANILISPEGEPLVTDFGIGTTVAGSGGQTTSVGFTPGYVAPETLNGKRPEAPADVYALGATLFQLIKGKAPFVDTLEDSGNLLALASRVVSEPIPDLRPLGVPDEICRVIEAAMAKEPEHRPTAGELASALLAAADGRRPAGAAFGSADETQPIDHRPPPPGGLSGLPDPGPGRAGTSTPGPGGFGDAPPPPPPPPPPPQPAPSPIRPAASGYPSPPNPQPLVPNPAGPYPQPPNSQPPYPQPGLQPFAGRPQYAPAPNLPAPNQAGPPPGYPATPAPPGPNRGPSAPAASPPGYPSPPPGSNAFHRSPGAPPSPPPGAPHRAGAGSGSGRSALPWLFGGVVGLLILVGLGVAVSSGGSGDPEPAPDVSGLGLSGDPSSDPDPDSETNSGTDSGSVPSDLTAADVSQPAIPTPAVNLLAPEARFDGEATPTCAGSTDGVLTFGGLLPLSGSISFLGRPMNIGAQLAVAEINDAGGVLGRPVEWVEGDSGSDATVGASAADRLVNQQADVVIGPALSSVSSEVIGPITSACRMQISPSNTATYFRDIDDEDLYFRTSPSEPLQGQALAELIRSEGSGSVYILSTDDVYGVDVGQATLDALGSDARLEFYPADTVDFSSWVADVVSNDPEALLLIGFEETAPLLQLLLDAGITPDSRRIYLADGNVGDNLGSAFAPGALSGVKGTVPGAEVSAAFLDQMVAYDSGVTDIDYGPETYDAVVISALAAEAAGTDDPARMAAVLNGITVGGEKCFGFAQCRDLLVAGIDIDYDGQSGPLSFDRTGDPQQAQYAVLAYGIDGTEIDRSLTEFRLVSRQ